MTHRTRTLTYSTRTTGRAPLATVRQATGATRGTVMVVHGGGFIGGWRDMPAVRTVADALVASGLHTYAPDYRLLFRGGRVPEAVEDIQTAWHHMTSQPDLAEPFFLVGLSAGAAVAAIAADDCAPAGLVLLYGPHDFGLLPRWAARAVTGTSAPDAIADLSPHGRCLTDAPTLVVHGAIDRLCPIAHSEHLVASRAAHNLPTTFDRLPDSGHGFLTWPARADSQQVVERVRSWLVDLGQ